MKSVSRFFSDMRGVFALSFKHGRGTAALYAACGIIRNARYPLVAFVSARLIEHVQASQPIGAASAYVWAFLLFYALLFALNRVWWPLNAYANNLLLLRLQHGIKRSLAEKAVAADYASFEQSAWLNELELARAEMAGRRPTQVINQAISMACAVITSAAMFLPLLGYKPIWAALMLLGSYAAFYANGKLGAKTFEFEKDNVRQKRKLTYLGKLLSDRAAVKEMHQLRLFDNFADRAQAIHQNYNKGLQKAAAQKIVGAMASWCLNALVCAGFYFVIVRETMAGAVSLGMLTFYLAAMESVADTIAQVSQAFGGMNQNRQYVTNLFKFLNRADAPLGDGGDKPALSGEYTLEFRNVSFTYPGGDKPALKNVSFALSGPGFASIVGLNGAGKTTLIKLLLRLYEPSEGAILFNGKNIREFDVKEWRKLFDVCFQDFYSYAFPLGEVLTFADLDSRGDTERLRQSAQSMGMDGKIMSLNKQYETCVGRDYDADGVEMSGGEKQRLALARVMFGSAPMVVMDEPTSAIDATTEARILELFSERVKDGFGFIVTHRLAYAAQSKEIIVLDGGELAEIGTHQQLMANPSGLYRELFTSQAQRYIVAEGGETA